MDSLYDDARPYMSDSEASDGDLYEDEPLPEVKQNQSAADTEQIYENADVIIQEIRSKEEKNKASQVGEPPDLPPVHPEGLRLKLSQGAVPDGGNTIAGARSPVRSRSPGIKRKNPLASSQTSTPPISSPSGSTDAGAGVLLLGGATVTESYVDEVEYLEMEGPSDDNNNKHQGAPAVTQDTDHQRDGNREVNDQSQHQGESGDEDEVTITTRD